MKRFLLPFVLIVLYFSCGNKKTQGGEGMLHPLVTHEVLHDASAAVVWVNDNQAGQSLIIGTDNDAEGALYAFNLNGDIVKKSAVLAMPQNPVVIKNLAFGSSVTDAVITVEALTGKVRVFSLPGFTPLDNGGIKIFEGKPEAAPGCIAVWARPSDKAVFVTIADTLAKKDCLWQYRLLANSRGASLSFVRKFGVADAGVQSMAINNASGFLYCSTPLGIAQYAADPALNSNEVISTFNCKNNGALVSHKYNGKYCLLASLDSGMLVLPLDADSGAIKSIHRFAQKVKVTASCNASVGDAYHKGMVIGLNGGLNFCCYSKQDIDKYIKF